MFVASNKYQFTHIVLVCDGKRKEKKKVNKNSNKISRKKIMPKKSNAFIFLYSLRKLPHTHFFLIEVKNKNQSNAPSFLCKRKQNKLCAFRPQSKKTKKTYKK